MTAPSSGERAHAGHVVIVGAGPVGLLLACLLADSGREITLLERRSRSDESSRSIGIHPPALEALELVGAAQPLIASGVVISTALVYLDGRPLGELSLDGCPPPFPFVLSVPQNVTETVLEECLRVLAPGALQRGRAAVALRLSDDEVRLTLSDGTLLEAGFVIGCDGRRSAVRGELGVEFHGSSHPDHYLMADLPDETDFACDAALFLGRGGVVESFPLPHYRRRWVARTRLRAQRPSLGELVKLVRERTGLVLDDRSQVAASAFTAETRLASSMAGERWALAGDAAHVISPIGGQGMNLGWLGARSLAAALSHGPAGWRPERYQRIQRRRAQVAARRARLNMALGSERLGPLLREAALRAILLPPLKRRSARYFTMRGL